MADNLFDQLFELFQSPGPVNWKLAREMVKSVAGEPEPVEPRLAEEYRELFLAAQLRIADHTPLDPPGGELYPVDGRTWATDNLEAFGYVINALAGNLDIFGGGAGDNPLGAMLAPLGPAVLGMQAASLVGMLGREVLGHFDTGLPALDSRQAMLVVPHVEAFAAQHGLDPQQVRLWATLHEATHHAVLAAPNVRPAVQQRMTDFFDSVTLDPSNLTDRLTGLQDPSQMQDLFGEGPADLAGLLGVEHDPGKLADVRALLAFMEGYADHLVRVTGMAMLPQLDRIEHAHRARRTAAGEATMALEQLSGLSLDRSKSEVAAVFAADIERRWGPESLAKVWDDPDHFPNLGELADPVGWAARVLLDDDLGSFGLADLEWSEDDESDGETPPEVADGTDQ